MIQLLFFLPPHVTAAALVIFVIIVIGGNDVDNCTNSRSCDFDTGLDGFGNNIDNGTGYTTLEGKHGDKQYDITKFQFHKVLLPSSNRQGQCGSFIPGLTGLQIK